MHRSVVYRSLVTCDDPKGVAESNKTIRKSKKNEEKLKKKEEKFKKREEKLKKTSAKEELQKLSCFQVMEVSRGAEKLNEVIGSLSNRPSIDTTSDLLRGALHLQDSLVMLANLQQASTFISNSNNNHKHKKEKEKMNSSSFKDDFDKPRISASRDCYDELREVIRESFARQNLLPKQQRQRDKGDVVDYLASSSSSSSLMNSNSSGCEEMMKSKSNLIAKLMGLEEAPSTTAVLKERIPNRRSPLLDIDLPRPKKPQFVAQKAVTERRTLEEIIEAMQFKGILERKSVNDCKLYSNASFLRKNAGGSNDYYKLYSNASFLRKNGGLSAADTSDSPPIVIMRPLSGRDREPHDHHWINGGERIKSQKMACKMREEFPQLRKSTSKQKILDEGKDLGKVRVRPVKKVLDSQDRVSTTKMNKSKPQMQKKEGVVEKKPKVAPNARKMADAKDAKPQRDLAKLTPLKQRKTVRENNAPKSQIAKGKVAGAGAGADTRMKPTSLNPTVPKKNPRKGELKSKPSSDLVENRQSDGNFAINGEIIIDDSLVKSTEEMAKAYYMSDNSRNAISSPSVDSGLITNDDHNHTEYDSCIPSFDSDQIKGCKSITNTRFLLLSSVSFLNHIEELFDTEAHDSTVFQTASSPDNDRVLHDSLLLDCAEEILERKSLRCRSTRNQWSQNLSRRQKYHLSKEQLVEEISDSIEDLQNYSRSCGDVVLADSIHPMLERDLWWNEEVTGAWDSGWRKGYAMEAVDEVMHDVEELVLSEIVADVIIGIMQ